MRDKVIASAAVASAGLAVAVGLTIGALGGAFDDSSQTVRPPALKSDSLSSVESTPTSTIVIVPPSPTWQVAVPTTARPTTTTPDRPESTTRSPRRTPSSDRTTTTTSEDESDEESSTTETESDAGP
ncbi:hypothetical protein CH251_11190 [Rhodococcus sp. 06-462-5]|uniref:hypothetical protein n=1 Tax=unclassified Rhodococcus (in: high G+C Gram-positive bacteria) TaxID=192944 RepID=UPI000B9A3ABE|nr:MULTISPECIES: hypothetical protein [unclassified Rhodococcus (in: high G+C Gram-positive bacteria)]OZC75314.1 hypothetical protein CH251_11190 [Rhodococcus sp. 06-462-5]OZE67833.1 hypothetical protein CH270_08790 [Rhodococcus sp. 02-925g]